MFWWLRELASSLQFLAIDSGETFLQSKRIYEVVLPTLLTFVFAIAYLLAPGLFVPGFVRTTAQNLFQFMVFVVPFHLAALGAFATFQRPVLDEPLKGAKAQIRVWDNQDNTYQWIELSLRQYASLLFGYLCSTGLVYICTFIIGSVIDFSFLIPGFPNYFRTFCASLLVLFISHYAFLSIYAITFLFEKVNGLTQRR